eukprot:scaffold13670_cov55-Cyclotella_meneghiniana.AAC.1
MDTDTDADTDVDVGTEIESRYYTTYLRHVLNHNLNITKRVITALGLNSFESTALDTPAEASPLPKDLGGLEPHVHQCARYTFKPTRRHELALIRIGRYLKGTQGKGLIMHPDASRGIDCYPDADFAGLYGQEDSQDPHCARSRTGYVILAFGCPVLWRSKLQTEIALSTMEAEYVALSTACKDLLPIMALVRELRRSVGLPDEFDANLHCKVHEDNVGALALANLEPQRMTPRSKHYAIKYHWFREHVHDKSNRIVIIKIDTKNQLGDMFTKVIPFPFLERECDSGTKWNSLEFHARHSLSKVIRDKYLVSIPVLDRCQTIC